jgi:hypothetical protein
MALLTPLLQGGVHSRFFWVDLYSGELCWSKSPEDFVKHPDASTSLASLCPVHSPAYFGILGPVVGSNTQLVWVVLASSLQMSQVVGGGTRALQKRKDFDPEVRLGE